MRYMFCDSVDLLRLGGFLDSAILGASRKDRGSIGLLVSHVLTAWSGEAVAEEGNSINNERRGSRCFSDLIGAYVRRSYLSAWVTCGYSVYMKRSGLLNTSSTMTCPHSLLFPSPVQLRVGCCPSPPY